MLDIQKFAEKLGIEIEAKNSAAEYPSFMKRVKNMGVCLLCDENTINYTSDILYGLNKNGNRCSMFVYPTTNLTPDVNAVEVALDAVSPFDYILAVGSDALNYIAGRLARMLKKKNGLFVTDLKNSVTDHGEEVSHPSEIIFDGDLENAL